MSSIVFDSTISGDKFIRELLNSFLREFVTKFMPADDECKERTIAHLLSLSVTDIQRYKSQSILQNKSPYEIPDLKDFLTSVGHFTNQWLSGCANYRHLFYNHYHEEWKGSVLGEENSYSIGQYNAMLSDRIINLVVRLFVRQQMILMYSESIDHHMRKRGQTTYVTCYSAIDQYGVSHPNPRYKGEKPHISEMTTQQPDLRVLWPYLLKYKLIVSKDVSGYNVAVHTSGESERCLTLLNKLKYTHLNIGGTPRRQVLNIGSGQLEHHEALDEKAVIGKNYWSD